jgi:hypothetical protein
MSLQFRSDIGYFSAMSSRAIRWLALALVVGCDERERLVFTDTGPDDGIGPVTSIDQPADADTNVSAGGLVPVAGRSIDNNGIDTIYVELEGAGQTFPPVVGGGVDTVRFGFSISTVGAGGTSIVVRVYAVDTLGNRGGTATRQLHVN